MKNKTKHPRGEASCGKLVLPWLKSVMEGISDRNVQWWVTDRWLTQDGIVRWSGGPMNDPCIRE